MAHVLVDRRPYELLSSMGGGVGSNGSNFAVYAPEDDLVAVGPARVGVVPACHGDKLPVVKARTQFELQHTGCSHLLGLHARFVRTLLSPARRTTSPHDELAD